MNRTMTFVAAIGLALVGGYFFFQPVNSNLSSGRALAEVELPTLNGAALAGEETFNAKCGSCHGQNAAGKDGVAPPLIHKIYEPSHHGDMAFVLAAKQGVRQHHWPFGNMPPVKDISDQQISGIITYIRTLQRANGIN